MHALKMNLMEMHDKVYNQKASANIFRPWGDFSGYVTAFPFKFTRVEDVAHHMNYEHYSFTFKKHLRPYTFI